jgi:hypothetical protein
VYFSKPKQLMDFEDCYKTSRFYSRMTLVFLAELIIFIALAVYFYTRTTEFWSPIILTACVVIASIGFAGNVQGWYPLGIWRRHMLKHKNTEKELAVIVEYEASLLGLEPVNKIEFRRKGELS